MAAIDRIKQVALAVVVVTISYTIVALIGLFMGCVVLFEIIKKGTKVLENKPRKRPECLDDPSLGEHGMVQLKDVKIHYVANGDKNAPLMLCLHGFPEFWYSWRHQLREFASQYRVVAIDMRGYGDSDKPKRRSSYLIKHLVGDIKQLVPALGYQSCTLVAHDWGGIVAWTTVSAYPELFDQLIILNSPHPKAFVDYISKNRSQAMKSMYMAFFQVPCLPELVMTMNDMARPRKLFRSKGTGVRSDKVTPEDVEAYVYNFSPPRSFTCPLNYYRAEYLPHILSRFGFGESSDKKPTLSTKVSEPMPVLVIWGDCDPALDIALAEKTKKYVDNVTVRYVEGAGHFVQIDQPEKVNEHMWRFLDENKQKTDLKQDSGTRAGLETETEVETHIKSDMDTTVETKNETHSVQSIREDPQSEPVLEPSLVKPESNTEDVVEPNIPEEAGTKLEAGVEEKIESEPGPENAGPIESVQETEQGTGETTSDTSEQNMEQELETNNDTNNWHIVDAETETQDDPKMEGGQ